jgi:quercetin dioxygenase-like cupin family protein
MDILDLTALGREHLDAARQASNGRSSTKLLGDHTATLRSNLIALTAGTSLQDHESPGEATLTVREGTITFHAGEEQVTLPAGSMLIIPPERHGLTALTDAVLVLTVAKTS